MTAAKCFEDDFVNPFMNGPNYDQFGPIIGSHCMGTNHQDITGVERVVFLGDSVTVGTPPTLSADYYRSKLAGAVAARARRARDPRQRAIPELARLLERERERERPLFA